MAGIHNLGIKDVMIAPRSPGQSPYVERVIGTLRRELLDHVIVMNEGHLRRLLRTYVADYYHSSRTHLSLDKDSPAPRAVEPPEMGEVVELPPSEVLGMDRGRSTTSGPTSAERH